MSGLILRDQASGALIGEAADIAAALALVVAHGRRFPAAAVPELALAASVAVTSVAEVAGRLHEFSAAAHAASEPDEAGGLRWRNCVGPDDHLAVARALLGLLPRPTQEPAASDDLRALVADLLSRQPVEATDWSVEADRLLGVLAEAGIVVATEAELRRALPRVFNFRCHANPADDPIWAGRAAELREALASAKS